jgi:glycosyltransferase involved in cell wall biosynthesis
MRVLLLSKYDSVGASSRLRSYQYLNFLERHGVTVQVAPLFDDTYIDSLYEGSISRLNILIFYLKRIWILLSFRSYDLLWVEKELFPWVPFFFESILLVRGKPIVVDYDDAVFHRYDKHPNRLIRLILKNKIDQIMSIATVVIAGSEYLVDRASKAGAKRIEKIPTVVDVDRYLPRSNRCSSSEIMIGWIGTPLTARYLLPLIPIFKALHQLHNIRVLAIGAINRHEFQGVIETVPWSEATEASLLTQIDIGIMPLPDEPFERGKCGYKLIQYMASGKPVIASPVGENLHIVKVGINGFLPTNIYEWQQYLLDLCQSESMSLQMGAAGREIVEKEYSLAITAPHLLRIFEDALS